jgi:hypothetical protein
MGVRGLQGEFPDLSLQFCAVPIPLRGFASSRLFLFLPQSTGKSCRTRAPRERTPGAEHRQTIAHSVSWGITSGVALSPGGAADPQARPCPLKRASEPSSTPPREFHPVPWAAAKHCAPAEAESHFACSPSRLCGFSISFPRAPARAAEHVPPENGHQVRSTDRR